LTEDHHPGLVLHCFCAFLFYSFLFTTLFTFNHDSLESLSTNLRNDHQLELCKWTSTQWATITIQSTRRPSISSILRNKTLHIPCPTTQLWARIQASDTLLMHEVRSHYCLQRRVPCSSDNLYQTKWYQTCLTMVLPWACHSTIIHLVRFRRLMAPCPSTAPRPLLPLLKCTKLCLLLSPDQTHRETDSTTIQTAVVQRHLRPQEDTVLSIALLATTLPHPQPAHPDADAVARKTLTTKIWVSHT